MDRKDKEIDPLEAMDRINSACWRVLDAIEEYDARRALRWHPLKRLRLWWWNRKETRNGKHGK